LDIELGSINTPNGFRQAVVQIPFRPGRTNTAAAIELARQQFIQNGREGVPHAIVLITDGLSNDKDATIQAAVNARGNGIEIFAIGVGAGVDSDELNAIATDPDSTHVSLLNSFSAQTLGSILKPLAQRVCTPVCQRQIDFMLVMDPAVDAANFNSVKQYFISLVAQFTIGPDAAQFGVVSYTSTDVMLGAKDDEDSLQMAITDIDFSPGVIRNTAVSINAAREQFILNGRTGVPKVLILVTSGPLSSSSRAAINTLRESGLEIFIVSNAEQVVADGVQSFTVSEFGSQSFSGILGDVVRESCNVPVCSTPPLDIIFALDGSGSVGQDNFMSLLNFIANITNQYTIGRTNGTQVGVVVFASAAHRNIRLPQFQTNADLSNAIVNLNYPDGGTATDLGLEQAREEFRINGRPGAKRVLIVATDGRSNNPVATSEQARLARSEDIEIFSVGIGSGANVDELNDVASDPSSAHVFTIANYSAQSLASVSQSLTTGICQEPVACSRLADAVFIIDSSVTLQDFPNVQQFIINAASQLDIRQSAIRIAIVQSTASVVLRLNDIRDTQAFINAVRSLSHNPTGITDLIAAIELAQSELRANGRTGAAQLIYVITARNTPLTISPSVDDSISLIAIGTSQNVLRSISSRVVAINDFALASLQSIQDATVDRICTQSPHCSLNIIFVLEASSSISSASFQLMLNYITRIVNQFEVSSTGSQVGVITFSNTAVSSIDIGSISGNSDIAQAIASIQQLASSGRRVDLAFGIAEAQLSSLSSSNRNVVFLITTGVSSNSVATINTVGLLNSLGDVEIFAVGVSSSISNEFRSELFEISTKQSGSRDFLLSSFNSLGGTFNSIIREFCDDDSSVQRDPVFAVPLNGPPDMPMLCYEVYGAPNKSFNLISDKCISINAHYTERVVLARHRPLHLIDRFGFKIVSSITNNCIDVLVEVTASGLLKTTLNGRVISNKLVVGDVHVTSTDQHFMFTSNNCANGLVAIAVQRKSIHQVGYLEMQLESGKGLTTTSHGLIGQFCNASVKVHSQGIELRDNHWSGSDSNNYRVMEFSSSDGSLLKRVPAILRSRTWGAEDVPCLYAGDSEGGRMYEVSSPNDPLIDGSYKDYITSSLFSPDFKYNQFNDKLCTSGVM
jgi:collagen type VI alpha